MSKIAIFNNDTGEYMNTIVAELTDECPPNWRMELVPEGMMWDGTKFANTRFVTTKTVEPISL